ncbi:MAG: ABC transporter permease [Anaerolineales bacterium]|jgi:ABC-2 type transport system permease protein
MYKSWMRLSALIQKETAQLLRDRRTLLYIIGLPLMELFLFAYAVSLTVYHLPTAVADQSQDMQSRDFIQALVNSQYFDFTLAVQDESQIRLAMDAGQVKAGIVIPPDFSTRLDNGDARVLILLDGSDSFSVQSGYSAANLVTQSYGLQLATQKVERINGGTTLVAQATSMPITNSFRVLYNPDFRDLWFVLPAIIGMILQTSAVAQAALVVVREREVGTIEQILATPTRPLELLFGKMIPLIVLCYFVMGLILAIGVFWFGVAFKGSLELYLLLTLAFVMSSLGLGFLISTVAKTQRQAQQISTVVMLFSMLLTGLVYPRNVMPVIPQLIGSMLPLTYFIRISRGIIMKGVGVKILWSDILALVVYSLAVMIVAALNFKKRLD